MKLVDWRKNDELLKSALMKMDLCFFRDKKTWEPHVLKRMNRKSAFEVACYDDNDNLIIEGIDTPASLGEVKTFIWGSAWGYETANIFYGVKSYEELAVKLDLMA
jgi:hypothetical protein